MILAAVAILGGVGLFFAIVIALANKQLKVYEDPRIDGTTNLLPGANCGACGKPGCRAFAEALVKGEAQPAGCNVMSGDQAAVVAKYLGVDAGEARKKVARLLCAGGTHVATLRAEYRGYESCSAAAAVGGGGKGCAWGCLGLADCEVSCNFGAIAMNEDGLPVVDVDKCTACGDCVKACPKGLFTILPLDASLLVQCRNLINGDEALEECRVACTACGKCVQDAAPGLISVASGVAVVNYDLIDQADERATRRCPTGAIVWIKGGQFVSVRGMAKAEAIGGSSR